MHRAALLLLLSMLSPGVARAEGDVFTQIQDWFSKLGKPQPPPPEDLGARNTFTLNPLALQNQQLGVEYERAFGKGLSLYLAPEFAYRRTEEAWQLTLAGTLGARLFVLGSAPSGIYFGPEVSTLYQRGYRGQVLRRSWGLGFGGSVGWTLVLFNKLTLSAGFSAQYRSVPDTESTEEGALRVEVIPTPRLAFGVAF